MDRFWTLLLQWQRQKALRRAHLCVYAAQKFTRRALANLRQSDDLGRKIAAIKHGDRDAP